jgi:8-oxo-dGTP pyrophosphatase MutT (NUDIX family)
MRLPLQVRRAAIRCAYVGLRVYWFLARPHIVGVKCILTNGDDVLFVRHTYGPRRWELPGGTVKRREVPLDAARREMQEELGRRIEDWVELGQMFISANHHHDNLHLFQAHVDDRRLELDLTELADARWFPLAAPPADRGRYVGRILDRVTGS